MKIDWTKWVFQYDVSNGWNNSFFAINQSEKKIVSVKINRPINVVDDTDKYIKDQCKIAIADFLISERLEQLKGQVIPVEDNLDYIENEAKRRGLI